ncbi:hypothetical protein JAAARDRAFT_196877 [Jaapia argillacea MUCL 33604]|uniref:Mre11 DNA-binding domain-containing protein n=1 Tax=Jaapia argillacea MUCL 33604 TaxID=933084 RepID=A0A067PH49_9AGAM|nr:hypothetical protein JAAARDRAFT_196877 [Jaapia argillacea MUCL 33604]
MALLREYTMGDKPIQIQLFSDTDESKAPGFSFPATNYEDPNFNIGIPVFSIHGNDDHPQGAGPEGALCALALLSTAGLVNYMGKFDLPLNDADAQNSGIAIRPVLLQKGNTKLGMYGVGNVKDARMHFELRSNRVRMFMPRDKDDWFNILLVHQNQHVALLQIQGKEFQLTPIPLRSVRPFVLDEVVLSEMAEEEGFDLTDQMEIANFLKARVNALIDQAKRPMRRAKR